ncbi:MAG: aminopeptidase [Treponema sp.]|jgi:leucyl aminopeptidase (aminopeptidase T)|nr:aminopeptidase [Treponema sp.]
MDKKFSKFAALKALTGASEALHAAARIAITSCLKVKPGEQVIIVSNPETEVAAIAAALYDASLDAGGLPVLLFQPVKTQMDFAELGVLAAFSAHPEVFISLSAEKLGKDKKGITTPYTYQGVNYDHIFHLQLYGEKTCRAFWSPATTIESFIRTVPIDYALLKRRCAGVKAALDAAVSIHITAPGGTDIRCSLRGRKARSDDGDFSEGGSGGNLPAGETFISPENGTAQGLIVFDGSISLHDRDLLIRDPIRCTLEQGFITAIQGGAEAAALGATIRLAETNARDYENAGTLPKGAGEIYARNARNIGEIGIGLNPAARIDGHMLEDEKAFHTCHVAVGLNYDDDAPCLIHLDGLVKNPTIRVYAEDGTERIIEQDGNLVEPIG